VDQVSLARALGWPIGQAAPTRSLAFGGKRGQHLGREHFGDGIEPQQAVAVGRAPVAHLGLAVAADEAVVAVYDRQDHARRAGIDEHDGAGEVGGLAKDGIGRRRISRADVG
jgi:hypothetical protein